MILEQSQMGHARLSQKSSHLSLLQSHLRIQYLMSSTIRVLNRSNLFCCYQLISHANVQKVLSTSDNHCIQMFTETHV